MLLEKGLVTASLNKDFPVFYDMLSKYSQSRIFNKTVEIPSAEPDDIQEMPAASLAAMPCRTLGASKMTPREILKWQSLRRPKAISLSNTISNFFEARGGL